MAYEVLIEIEKADFNICNNSLVSLESMAKVITNILDNVNMYLEVFTRGFGVSVQC